MARTIIPNNIFGNYLDSIFDDFPGFRPLGGRVSMGLPAVNIREHEDRYEISMLTPGLDPEKISVEVTDKVVHISYQHEDQDQDTGGNLVRQEFSHFSFARAIALPKNVDESTLRAEMENGVLLVIVDKTPEAQPRKISVQLKKKS